MTDNQEKKSTFAFRLSKEKLGEFRGLSAEEKLNWLDAANKFVADFVPEEKRRRWKEFVDRQGDVK
ncbi:MAG: hypothetical protein HZB33_05305 [Nitrospirae bacterium]|nr:hypothetical protein [Nitrospirota bacterium]